MKKLLTMLFVTALLPLTALTAKPADYMKPLENVQGQTAKALDARFSKVLKANPVSDNFLLQRPKKMNGQWDTLGYRFFFMGYSGVPSPQTQIVYEPQTNSVVYFFPEYEINGTTCSEEMYAQIYNNGGKDYYGTVTVASGTTTDGLTLWLNGAAINSVEGNTDPAKLNMMVNGIHYGYNATKGGFYSDGEGIMAYAGQASGDPISTIKHVAPVLSSYGYSMMNSVATKQDVNVAYLMGSPLFAQEGTSAVHGRYSFLGFENNTDHDFYLNQFSSEFGVDKFKAPTSTGIYNDYNKFDKDSEGTIYTLVNNIYVDNENRRYPAVAKSTDMGSSWSAFDKMPWDVLDQFVLSLTGNQYEADDVTSFMGCYDVGSFTVTGVDEFSYVTNFACVDKATSYYYWYGPIEVYKKNGTWGIRKIEDMRTWSIQTSGDTIAQGVDPVYLAYSDEIDGSNTGIIRDFVDRAHEVEVSRTADNQYIVAKWTEYKYTYDSSKTENISGTPCYLKDYESYITTLADSFNIYYQGSDDKWYSGMWDFYRPQNIYVKYRKIDEDKWSDAINVTDDNHYHMHTHMPKILPNFTSDSKCIPFMTTISRQYDRADSVLDANVTSYAEYIAYKRTMSPTCWDMIYNYNRHFLYATVDLEKDESVVREESVFNVGVYPNPATNEFTVKAETEGLNRVEIYTVLGEKVMEFSGMQQRFDVNSASLSNGVYVVKVINNNNVSTAMITIAK